MLRYELLLEHVQAGHLDIVYTPDAENPADGVNPPSSGTPASSAQLRNYCTTIGPPAPRGAGSA